ncbi:MAG: hypothetical protein H6705_16485 [Myxococcales bacterium]|nr:hypothetical protein [Myxococcales bacterium]
MAPPVAWPPVHAQNAVPPDHPLAAGQHHYLNETWGEELRGGWPPADFLLALLRDDPDFFGEQFSNFGYLPDPDDDLPIGLKRGSVDPTRVAKTCALCHIAERPDGTRWLGLPNTRLRPDALRAEVSARWVAAGNPPLMDDLERDKALALGPGRASAEPAGHPQIIAIDFPPYFDQGRRRHFGSMGVDRDARTSAYLSLFLGSGVGHPNDAEALIPWPQDDRPDRLVDFLVTLAPPPAPPVAGDIDRGAQVFAEAGCGDCHHPGEPERDGVIPLDRSDPPRARRPGEDPDWPDGSIDTDPLVLTLQSEDMGEGGIVVRDVVLFIARHLLRVGPTDGYRVPELVALWATAPYLHNGSVPTLQALLSPPAERPVSFELHGFVYDTALPGNGNGGHAFGVDLPPDDKAALIAWLMSR